MERREEESLRNWDEVSGQSTTTRLTASQSHFSFAKHRFKDAAQLDKPGMSAHHRVASGLCCPTPETHFNSVAVRVFSQLLLLSPILQEPMDTHRRRKAAYAAPC